MDWMSTCGPQSRAKKRYEKRVFVTMGIYVALLLASVTLVKHWHVTGWALYVAATAPALPVIVTLIWIGVYLHEETDEFLRVIMTRALLVGTGSVMGLIVVSDFLQAIAGRGALPPFTYFVIFFVGFGVAQAVQGVQNRVRDDD